MLNRTNRTLSATTHGLNLGTRTLAIHSRRNNNGMTLRLRRDSFVVAHPSDPGSMPMKRWSEPEMAIAIAGSDVLPAGDPGSDPAYRTRMVRSPRCAVAPLLQPQARRVPRPTRPQQGRVGVELGAPGAREAASMNAAAARRAAAAG